MYSVCVNFIINVEYLRDNYYLNVIIVYLYELMIYNCIYLYNIFVKVMEKCWVYVMFINKFLFILCRDIIDINFIL